MARSPPPAAGRRNEGGLTLLSSSSRRRRPKNPQPRHACHRWRLSSAAVRSSGIQRGSCNSSSPIVPCQYPACCAMTTHTLLASAAVVPRQYPVPSLPSAATGPLRGMKEPRTRHGQNTLGDILCCVLTERFQGRVVPLLPKEYNRMSTNWFAKFPLES